MESFSKAKPYNRPSLLSTSQDTLTQNSRILTSLEENDSAPFAWRSQNGTRYFKILLLASALIIAALVTLVLLFQAPKPTTIDRTSHIQPRIDQPVPIVETPSSTTQTITTSTESMPSTPFAAVSPTLPPAAIGTGPTATTPTSSAGRDPFPLLRENNNDGHGKSSRPSLSSQLHEGNAGANARKEITREAKNNSKLPKLALVVAPPAPSIAAPVLVTHIASPIVVAATIDLESCAEPKYPSESMRKEEQGASTLSFFVSTDGKVVDSRIDKSSGYRALDSAGIAAFARCKFKPRTLDGVPQASWIKVRYEWKIE